AGVQNAGFPNAARRRRRRASGPAVFGLGPRAVRFEPQRRGPPAHRREAGRRLFFHPNGPGCSKCHTVNGRGGRVGPDLSRIVESMNRIQLIQSILEPSAEIAPQFVSWAFETVDGKLHTGMLVHENEGKTVIGDAEGKTTELKTIDIVQ